MIAKLIESIVHDILIILHTHDILRIVRSSRVTSSRTVTCVRNTVYACPGSRGRLTPQLSYRNTSGKFCISASVLYVV